MIFPSPPPDFDLGLQRVVGQAGEVCGLRLLRGFHVGGHLDPLSYDQWIGLGKNLQESPIFHEFNGKIYGFRLRFSLKLIH